MKHEIICTIHNFKWGFQSAPDGIDEALIRCPICLEKELRNQFQITADVIEHRNLLLKAIDLKKVLLSRGEVSE